MININADPNGIEVELARQIHKNGYAVLKDVSLPSSFVPRATDIVFIPLNAVIEVYISSANRYLGHSTIWQEVMTRPEITGGARKVVVIEGDISEALAAIGKLLREVGELNPIPSIPNTVLSPQELTDLDSIKDNLQESKSIYIDEDLLLQNLQNYVRGQDPVLRTLAHRVSLHLARISPRHPLILFAIGPTGVGKTKTAESLPLALRSIVSNGLYFSYLRLDMSEYRESHRVSQLLGAPQGYVGYGEGAQLVDALSSNPRTIVLFDEIEKAHPAIFLALMNAMDAGRLSTPSNRGNGREIDCRLAIFIFTSNIESKEILRELNAQSAFDQPTLVDRICRQNLNGVLQSELIGRIGAFLVFQPLTPIVQAEIVTLSVTRVAEEYGLEVRYIEPTVISFLLAQNLEKSYGVRPYEYQIDDVLGETFAYAARENVGPLVTLHGGPPFECRIIQSGLESDQAMLTFKLADF